MSAKRDLYVYINITYGFKNIIKFYINLQRKLQGNNIYITRQQNSNSYLFARNYYFEIAVCLS